MATVAWFVGPRNLTDPVMVIQELDHLPKGSTVLHAGMGRIEANGMIHGVDLLTAYYAEHLGHAVERVVGAKETWDCQFPRSRGENGIARLTRARREGHEVVVVAFHDDRSPSGQYVAQVVRLAALAGIPVRLVSP